jgi:leucyl-tRNA synthetase
VLPLWRSDGAKEIVRTVHAALKSIADELDSRRFHFNTTLARLDELINAMSRVAQQPGGADEPALLYAVRMLPLLLAAFAPHIAEELWHRMEHEGSVHLELLPQPDPAALAVDQVTLVVQVNGKIRGRITSPPGLAEEAALAAALADENVRAHLGGKEIRKRIYVPDKLLNLVV